MYGTDQATVEACVATAMRAMSKAGNAADRMGDEGLEDDIFRIQIELTRIGRSLIDKPSRGLRTREAAQTKLV